MGGELATIAPFSHDGQDLTERSHVWVGNQCLTS
jgi:hypothetical protein